MRLQRALPPTKSLRGIGFADEAVNAFRRFTEPSTTLASGADSLREVSAANKALRDAAGRDFALQTKASNFIKHLDELRDILG